MAVSCYTFANVGMKSDDYYFVGFPALWNVVVLYFFVLQTGPLTNLLTIAFLCVLTFIPIKFVHPLRVAHWREITMPMTVLWAAMSLSPHHPGQGPQPTGARVEDIAALGLGGGEPLFPVHLAVAHLRPEGRPRATDDERTRGLTSGRAPPYMPATDSGGVAQLVRARES